MDKSIAERMLKKHGTKIQRKKRLSTRRS